MKIMKNKIYGIPDFIMPPSKSYEIEVKIYFFKIIKSIKE
jgi:hypothetical protein